MWLLVLQLLGAGFYLQVATCYRSCILNGQRALCSGQWFYQVPALPPNITHLFLDRNYIRELSSASLEDFAELQDLDLGNQKVKLVIRNNGFLQQRNMTRLVLGFNIGLQLEPRAFAGLDNLQSLFLDHCRLTDAILTNSFLQPLRFLETLDLFGNRIMRLQPGLFFSNLTRFTQLNLKLNQIEKFCEGDLVGFKGKYFQYLNLTSNKLFRTPSEDWFSCGNPFKGIAFNILDLSYNGLNKKQITQFFKAIQGTQIAHLKYSGPIGKGFSHENIPDPDESTFEGLNRSAISILDLSKNFIFCLQKAVFSPLKDINPNAFDGLQGHLRMLNLSFNLLVLDLSYNHIGVLGDDAFSKLPRLRGLFLTGNSLRGLGLPAMLPNLEYLTLGDNKLSSIYNLITLGSSSTYVDVSDNRLTDMEDVYVILTHFKRLQKLFFGGNFIKWCTLSKNIMMPQNNSLEVLDLHDSSHGHSRNCSSWIFCVGFIFRSGGFLLELASLLLRTVVSLSDGWCLEAFSLAQGRMLEELKNILIMVVVGKVTHYQLMKVNAIRAFVKRRDYLVWPEDPQDLDWFYERLFSQILKDIKVKEFEEDKPEPEVELDVEDGMELENMGAVAM
uniref:Toll-like receptor 5 n=1 Tax=Amphiprion ocellaris TaxID=80972 RepID=A0A3Q1CFC2_AMPOC